MEIKLHKAGVKDCNEIYNLQIKSFKELLEKYKDYDFSPGAEKVEKTINRLNETSTDYYFIRLNDKNIGAIRIAYFDDLCILKQISILPEYQGNGYAQQAIIFVETLYPNAAYWELDTIKQEEKLCYLYDKMGYRQTGKEQNIKDGMDLVFYAKCIKSVSDEM